MYIYIYIYETCSVKKNSSPQITSRPSLRFILTTSGLVSMTRAIDLVNDGISMTLWPLPISPHSPASPMESVNHQSARRLSDWLHLLCNWLNERTGMVMKYVHNIDYSHLGGSMSAHQFTMGNESVTIWGGMSKTTPVYETLHT